MLKAVAFVVPVCCLVPLSAQAVHLVGPGGYPQITAAIAAAAPGDIVLVQPGQYEMFFLNKALTIRATAPGAAAVVAGTSPFGSANLVTPPTGSNAHIVGMRLGTTYLWGATTLDGCVLDTPRGSLFIEDTTAVLQGCTLTPVLPNPPLFLSSTLKCTDADVTVIDSTIHGVLLSASLTTRPIELVNTKFRGSGLTVYCPGPGLWPALQGDAASRVWLSDSTLTSAPGTCFLPVSATIVAANGRYDRCTLTPNCSLLPAGFVLGIDALQPPQNGAPFTLEFRAQPNSMVGVFAAHTIESWTLPGIDQSALLSVATAFHVGNLIADNTGLAVGTWLVPAGAMFVDVPLWFQGVAGPAFPLQVSAVAGGLVR